MRTVATACAVLAALTTVAAYGPSNPHYGAGRRIPMSSVKTLTLYDSEYTAARRTEAVPQLNCQGKACKRYRPDAVVCQSLGSDQWKCQADLPPSLRLGRVEVSCEGWDSPSDPYILKDSCAVTYHLLPAYNSHMARENYTSSGHTFQDLLDFLFPIFFLGAAGWILYGLWRSVRRNGASFGSSGSGRSGNGGGGWGGGGGGWGPGHGPGGGGGGDSHPPPPYSKQDSPGSTGAQSAWRPGFWTGLLAGTTATAALNRRGRGSSSSDRAYAYDPYTNGGGLGAGWAPPTGGHTRAYGGDSFAGSSTETRSATGYGGTRNR
ncbi:unnamed protein product [Parajaminaea phylloscopi]